MCGSWGSQRQTTLRPAWTCKSSRAEKQEGVEASGAGKAPGQAEWLSSRLSRLPPLLLSKRWGPGHEHGGQKAPRDSTVGSRAQERPLCPPGCGAHSTEGVARGSRTRELRCPAAATQTRSGPQERGAAEPPLVAGPRAQRHGGQGRFAAWLKVEADGQGPGRGELLFCGLQEWS